MEWRLEGQWHAADPAVSEGSDGGGQGSAHNAPACPSGDGSPEGSVGAQGSLGEDEHPSMRRRLRELQRENEALYYTLQQWRRGGLAIHGTPVLEPPVAAAVKEWSTRVGRDDTRMTHALATSSLTRRLMRRDR